MSIIVWIIIGGLAGWIANMIMKTDGSLVKNIVTASSVRADRRFRRELFGAAGFTGFQLWSFLVALIGSDHSHRRHQPVTGKRALSDVVAHEPKAGGGPSTKRPNERSRPLRVFHGIGINA